MNRILLFFMLLPFFINISYGDIVFETDFSEDEGYSVTSKGGAFFDSVPDGWDAVIATGNSRIEVISGLGNGNKPALKLSWDPDLGQPVVSLLKHLTGDKNTGYKELFIRYHVKLPANFKAGNGVGNIPYWKWGRLWQNTATLPTNSNNTWTENRVDSYYAVWNFGGTETYGVDINTSFGANTGSNLDKGSAGGEQYAVDFYGGVVDYSMAEGHFQAVGSGAWDIDWDTNPGFLKTKVSSTPQEWHTIEYHIKLASNETANDGVWEVWFDGTLQNWVRLKPTFGAEETNSLGIPTAKIGSGFNFLVFFDNMAEWNKDWGLAGVDGYILVNDVIVSDERIGHDYIVGQPAPPTNLTIAE